MVRIMVIPWSQKIHRESMRKLIKHQPKPGHQQGTNNYDNLKNLVNEKLLTSSVIKRLYMCVWGQSV